MISIIKNLSLREKRAITVMAVCIGLAFVVKFVIFPALDRRTRLEKAIAVKTKQMTEIILLKNEYESLVRQNARAKQQFARREKGFTLFSFMDRLAGQAGVKETISYMKPFTIARKDSPFKTTQVELKLSGVIMDRFVSYLQMVETSPNMVYVRKLSISKPDGEKGLLNAILQVEAQELKQ